MKYKVYMTIHNIYEVEAESEGDADEQVRALGVWETLDEAEYLVTEVKKLEEVT